ncbi:hypothetical protein YB2330_005000 [Saitoella coloradoensis]
MSSYLLPSYIKHVVGTVATSVKEVVANKASRIAIPYLNKDGKPDGGVVLPKKPENEKPAPPKPIIKWKFLPPVMEAYRPARRAIVLCHGLYGFDKIGFPQIPALNYHYWGGIYDDLTKLGCTVIVTKVPSTGSIEKRAQTLHEFLEKTVEKGTELNFLAHSMGGLDVRHLLANIITKGKGASYRPVSLTTLSTPHQGSAFMDWCRDYLGLGRISLGDIPQQKPSPNPPLSATVLTASYLAGLLDTPAYGNLTTNFMREVFNPRTPDNPNVSYFSFGARVPEARKITLWHPLYLPHHVVTENEGRDNDGLVSVKSATWGEYVDTFECDHWDLRGRPGGKGLGEKGKEEIRFEVLEMYRAVSTMLNNRGF